MVDVEEGSMTSGRRLEPFDPLVNVAESSVDSAQRLELSEPKLAQQKLEFSDLDRLEALDSPVEYLEVLPVLQDTFVHPEGLYPLDIIVRCFQLL